jgi:hypothetical protein
MERNKEEQIQITKKKGKKRKISGKQVTKREEGEGVAVNRKTDDERKQSTRVQHPTLLYRTLRSPSPETPELPAASRPAKNPRGESGQQEAPAFWPSLLVSSSHGFCERSLRPSLHNSSSRNC